MLRSGLGALATQLRHPLLVAFREDTDGTLLLQVCHVLPVGDAREGLREGTSYLRHRC